MEHTEKTWNDTDFSVESFSKNLGFSKSQLYRKMQGLTNKSVNSFIKDYRLKKACEFMKKKKGNISEIAFETGFNSPAYFTKCFQEAYGILPSDYLKTRALNFWSIFHFIFMLILISFSIVFWSLIHLK